ARIHLSGKRPGNTLASLSAKLRNCFARRYSHPRMKMAAKRIETNRRAIIEAEDWEGPSFQASIAAASVCHKFETSRRREALSFNHYREVAAFPAAEADALLDWCEETD